MPPKFLRNPKDDFELDAHAEGKAGHADHRANGQFVAAEDLAEQIGGTVSDSWLIEEISRRSYKHAEPNNARDAIKRTRMLPGRCERA
jgi:hypothetical protein